MALPVKIASNAADTPPSPSRARITDEIMDRIRRPFLIGMAILLAAGLGSYFALERYRSSNTNVARSDEVIEQLDDLLSNIDRAEAVERGYITNGGNGYSLSMPALAAAIHQDLDKLKRAAAEGTLPPAEVTALAGQVEGKLQFYDQLAATRSAQGEPAATAMFTAGQGHDLIGDIHDRVQQMGAAQERLLASRVAHEHLFSHLLGFIVVSGCILAFVSVAYAGYFIDGAFRLMTRHLTDDARVREALAALNETLEERIAERSAAAEQRAMELARVQKETRHQEQILQAVLSFISEGVLVCDTHMRLLQSNAAAERILGEGFGQQSLDHLPQAFEMFPLNDETALEGGKWPLAEAIRGRQSLLNFRLRNKQTGMVHLIESRSSPLRDESGAVGAAVGLIRDRTPELKAEHAAALMESITASSDDAYIALARDGKVSGWNPAAVRMFGYEPEEIIGHACRRLISDRMIGHTREITQRMLDGGGPERFELEVLRKDGSSLPVLIEVFPAAETPNQRTVFMVICRDRSGRKAIEAEAAKARAMAEESARRHFDFLINMSQELTASINRISAVMPLLLESPLQAQQREYVRAAASGSEELLETVSQVLYLAQLAAGQVVFEQNEFDLYETVEGAMDAAAERGQSKDIELVLAVGPELPRRLIGDGRRTAQALATLVESAVRFNDQGEVVVSVDCEERGADYTVVRFEVRDTGAGMPPEMKARLFQPFAGLEARTGRGRADTGLGLAIAARLIERMGSSAISADGESGHGSVFRYTLRFANVPGPAAQPDGWGQLAPHRVLVADDNSANRVSVCRQLALWGLAPDSAIGGAEALMAIRQRAAAGTPYDLVLADMRMPGMDGFALARAIKSDPRLKDARLVMMGPYGVPEQPDTDGWLVKPIKPTRLLACLQAIAGSAGTDRGGIADGGIGVAAREGASPANVSGVIGHASPADYESLDSSVLAELRALASDDEGRVVDGLINTFMRELQPRLAQLEMALSSGDMAGLAALAKSLRARSAGLGLTRMAALCADLSASGQNSDRRPPAIILASLRDEAARLGPLLERQRAAAPAEVAA